MTATPSTSSATPQTARRPNVLWLMSDQHNAACPKHAGRRVRTPNLDQIAATGVRFTQAFCNNPICSPSRISYITERYPHSHQLLGNDNFAFPERNPNTLAALARRYGYQTTLVGKAHMVRAWDRWARCGPEAYDDPNERRENRNDRNTESPADGTAGADARRSGFL